MKKLIKMLATLVTTVAIAASAAGSIISADGNKVVIDYKTCWQFKCNRGQNLPSVIKNGSYFGKNYTRTDNADEYHVYAIQSLLGFNGCSCQGIDGIFGNNTHNATVKYQRNKGLSADGIVGKDTYKKLTSDRKSYAYVLNGSLMMFD